MTQPVLPTNSERARELTEKFEKRPDPQALTANSDPSKNSSSGVDYEPHPEKSIALSPEREKIVKSICALYSGSASEEDAMVYASEAIYDDPYSYCDSRKKIFAQWQGITIVFAESKTLATEVVESTDDTIIFKLRQEYTPRLVHFTKAVNSLVTLTLDKDGLVRYHKDMWNEKDYSHEGLGKVMKTLNGDHLPKLTQPPDSLA